MNGFPEAFAIGPQIAAWNPNGSYCENIHTWDIGSIHIYDPSMVLCATLGMLIGLLTFYIIHKSEKPLISRDIFSLTFLTFACMNLSGMLVFCFVPHTASGTADLTKLSSWLIVLDGTFSSCTSINFLFSALSDFNILDMKRRCDKTFVFSTYALILVAYILLGLGLFQSAWVFFYVDLTVISTLVFVVLSLLRQFFIKDLHGVGYLIISAVGGVAGLFLLQSPQTQSFFCNWMGGYFSGMDMWYLQSDFSLFLLALYYFTTHIDKDAFYEKLVPLRTSSSDFA